MNYFDLKNKWFVWPLFFLLFSYAIVRAITVEPLLDELGTFYWYIQTGLFPGHGAILDTNNHILNSFVSTQLYNAFGDHFFLYRIFALIGFPIYFFACKRFLTRENMRFSVLVFLALLSVHWVFDYFSLSRGYSCSLAFFMLACCSVQQWLRTYRTKYFAGFVVCGILTLLSNLSLLIPVALLFGFLVLCIFVFRRSLAKKQLLYLGLNVLLFIAFLVPAYIYLNKLKKANALWWGSTDGLWEVTGKSLCRNVVFSEHIAWKYVLIALLALLAVLFLLRWKKIGTRPFLKSTAFWIPGLFFLCLLSAVFMAEVMKVNYPMDRVGMYLIPIFFLTLGVLLHDVPVAKWSLLGLLWFPGSFLYLLNTNTTVFSPEDRIHRDFYAKIKQTVQPGDQLSADYVIHNCYAYTTRYEKEQYIATEFNGVDTLALGDYHISWLGNAPHSGYRLLMRDPVSKTALYKRTTPSPKRMLIKDTTIAQLRSKALDVVLLRMNIPTSSKEIRFLQTDVSASIQLKKPSYQLHLVQQTLGAGPVVRFSQGSRFDWYFGSQTNYRFRYPNQLFPVDSIDQQLQIHLHNEELQQVDLKNVRIRVYTVKRP